MTFAALAARCMRSTSTARIGSSVGSPSHSCVFDGIDNTRDNPLELLALRMKHAGLCDGVELDRAQTLSYWKAVRP